RAGPALRCGNRAGHLAAALRGHEQALAERGRAEDRGAPQDRHRVRLRRGPLPLRRDVSRDGPRRDRAPAVLPARRQLLRRLRPEAQDEAHADHHAGREPLRLPLHLRGGSRGRGRARPPRDLHMACVPPPVSEALAGACFAPDYASARARFLAAAARAGARVDVFVNDVATGPGGGSLTTDVAVLGPAHAPAALMLVSGRHGTEGFVGSAAQGALLGAVATGVPLPPVRVVLVHAINPYAFAHITRTTENNVDLNRNFIDWSAGAPGNPAYAELHEALCPSVWTPEALAAADAARTDWIGRNGQDAFVDM